MVEIPYDLTLDSLIHPGLADDFFTYGVFVHGQFPSEAALCAEMSRLVYVKQVRRLDEYLKRADFTLLDAIGYDEEFSETQYFLAGKTSGSGQPIVVVAIRGSEPDDYKDWIADVSFLKQKWAGEGRVHVGFRNAVPDMNVLVHKLAPFESANPRARVLFTGHSLGAAIAVLTAALHHPDYLYTFGCPRVGDRDFAESLHFDHARYQNCHDLVTLVPPPSGYTHVGEHRYINRSGKLEETTPSVLERAADQGFAVISYIELLATYEGRPEWLVLDRGLADHSMINYLSGVMGLRT
jgi:hypothetical protein